MGDADPIIGTWYRELNRDHRFEVVALDDKDGAVEIQDFDGNLDTIDLEAWYELSIEPIEAPEDWTGPIDDIERDDLGYSESG